MRRPSPHHAITAAAALAGLVLFAIAPEALLLMAPAIALAWLVGIGALTGEEAVAWVRRVATRLRRRSRGAAARLRAPRPGRSHAPRGRVLAAALASRPPPITA